MTSTTAFARHSALEFAPGPFVVHGSASDAGGRRGPERPQVRTGVAPRYGVRRLGAALALVLSGALLWTFVPLVAGIGETSVGAQADRVGEPTVHIVQPGETLWSIASGIDADGDPRDTVDRLAEANGSVALQVGQRLVID